MMNEETQALLELGVIAVSSTTTTTTTSSSKSSKDDDEVDVRSMILGSLPRIEVKSPSRTKALLREGREERKRRREDDGSDVVQAHNGLTKLQELKLEFQLVSILNDQVTGKVQNPMIPLLHTTTSTSDLQGSKNNPLGKAAKKKNDLLGNIFKKKKDLLGNVLKKKDLLGNVLKKKDLLGSVTKTRKKKKKKKNKISLQIVRQGPKAKLLSKNIESSIMEDMELSDVISSSILRNDRVRRECPLCNMNLNKLDAAKVNRHIDSCLRRQKNKKTPKGIPTKIPVSIGKKKKKRTMTTTITTLKKKQKRRKISSTSPIDSEAIESVCAIIPNLNIRTARYYLRRTKSNVQSAINMILDRRRMSKDGSFSFSSEDENSSDDDDNNSSDDDTTTTTTTTKRNKSKSGIEDDFDDDIYQDRIDAISTTTQYHDISSEYKVPIELWSKLYDHQKIGVKWLWRLHKQGTGGILGDEMGLGKTLQIVTHVAALQASNLLVSGVLIVCPATMMAFWMQQFHLWYPQTRVMIMHECSRVMRTGQAGKNQLIAKALREKGVLLCTYAAVRRSETLQHAPWHYIVLDEGHHIKNEDALVTKAVKAFQTPHRILLSGAPVQNNLKELWCLMDFVYPGRLGTAGMFESQFASKIRKGGYKHANRLEVELGIRMATALRDLIKPYMMRRMKRDCKLSLPTKTEQVLFCELSESQIEAYLNVLNSSKMDDVMTNMSNGNGGRSNLAFSVITSLRKICNHPDLVLEKECASTNFGDSERSGKLKVLEKVLPIWKSQGHRALVFATTRQVLNIIEICVKALGLTYDRMDGTTPIDRRQKMIDAFNDNKSDITVFLLTSKVGGFGVNLTGADRVVLFEPDWNPASDMQARERSWRVGQSKDVTVYRLICTGTIEEKVYQRQIHKMFLTNKVLVDPRQRRVFTCTGLYDLFSLTVKGKTFGPKARRLSRRQRKRIRAQASSKTETGSLFRGGEMNGDGKDDDDDDDDDEKDERSHNAAVFRALVSGNDNAIRTAFDHDVVEGGKKRKNGSSSSSRTKNALVRAADTMARTSLAALKASASDVESAPLTSKDLLSLIRKNRGIGGGTK